MALHEEQLPDTHTWWRIADVVWRDPLDPSFAQRRGGRWNPPDSFPTLYLNEDLVTARLNLRNFIAGWPYEPEDLREDTGPILIGTQFAASTNCLRCALEARGRRGRPAGDLPFRRGGTRIPHARCQSIGARAKAAGLRGVRARSAQSRDGAGRELAWFPATARSVARRTETLTFEDWFWG